MRADNSIHLITAAKQRHEYARAKALAAMHELDRAGVVLTFESVARHAGVSRSWIYTQTDIKSKTRSVGSATRANTNAAHRYPLDTTPAMTPYANVLNWPTAATANSLTRTRGCGANSPTPSANSATTHGSRAQTNHCSSVTIPPY